MSSGVIPDGGVRGGSHSAGRCGFSKKSRDAVGKSAKSSESSKG